MTVVSSQRFTADHPCPVCNGCQSAVRGHGERCFGFLSDDEDYAHCTRAELAGELQLTEASETYAHKLQGPCRCGNQHSAGVQPVGKSPNIMRQIDCTYDYQTADGSLLFQVVRYAPKDFRQRRPDGEGAWIWKLDGIIPVLYRLPELLASDPTKPIFIPEGEKSSNKLAELGLGATNFPRGAGKSHLVKDVSALDGRHVVVLPDNDGVGRSHGQQIADRLYSTAKSVRVLQLPDLPDGGDVYDWLNIVGTTDKLVELARQCDPWEPQITTPSLRFMTAKQVGLEVPATRDWVIFGYAALGCITELDGKIKAAGKTTWLTHACRKVVEGSPFMGGSTKKTAIVYLTEQGPSSFREALRRADLLDREDFHILHYQDAIGQPWNEVIESAVRHSIQVGAKLLIIDTLPQFAGLKGDSENNSGAALEAVQPLQMAAAHGMAVVLVRHERKSGGDVGDSGRGSSAFGGAVDCITTIRRGDGNSAPTVRVLQSLSRFDETPDQLVIDYRDGEYVALGSQTQVARLEAHTKLLASAPTSEADALKAAELCDLAEVKATVGKEVINELVRENILRRIGSGKRNDAYKFWKPQLFESEGDVVATETDEVSGQWFQSRIEIEPATQLVESVTQGPGCLASNGTFPPIDSVATTTLYSDSNNTDVDDLNRCYECGASPESSEDVELSYDDKGVPYCMEHIETGSAQ